MPHPHLSLYHARRSCNGRQQTTHLLPSAGGLMSSSLCRRLVRVIVCRLLGTSWLSSCLRSALLNPSLINTQGLHTRPAAHCMCVRHRRLWLLPCRAHTWPLHHQYGCRVQAVCQDDSKWLHTPAIYPGCGGSASQPFSHLR